MKPKLTVEEDKFSSLIRHPYKRGWMRGRRPRQGWLVLIRLVYCRLQERSRGRGYRDVSPPELFKNLLQINEINNLHRVNKNSLRALIALNPLSLLCLSTLYQRFVYRLLPSTTIVFRRCGSQISSLPPILTDFDWKISRS